MEILKANSKNINKLASLLKAGELVIIPTETVYGLAADASSETAVKNIYKAKSRPDFNPLISHYASLDEIKKDTNFIDKAEILAKKFWPGPLTMVLNKSSNSRISATASANLETAAVRIPRHEASLELLSKFAGPIAAPSANPSGKLSPSKIEHVQKLFRDKIKWALAGELCEIGLESTVLDLSSDNIKILRYGAISSEEISKALDGEKILEPESETGIKAPGMLLRHYSPKASVKLNFDINKINQYSKEIHTKKSSLLAFNLSEYNPDLIQNSYQQFYKIYDLSPKGNLEEAAQKLFAYLHELDDGIC